MRSQIFRQTPVGSTLGVAHRNFAGILSYVKEFLCTLTENMQADEVLRL